jgi:hypothetical protein
MRWIALILLLVTTGCAAHKSTVTVKVSKHWDTPQTTIEGTQAEIQVNVEL